MISRTGIAWEAEVNDNQGWMRRLEDGAIENLEFAHHVLVACWHFRCCSFGWQ